MKKAIVSVKSFQKNNPDSDIKLMTPGRFYKKDDIYYVVYEETEISGMSGTTTTFKISPDSFLLLRQGTTGARMKFKCGDENISMYNTPYGVLEIIIKTNDLKINVDENGGEVSIDYDIILEGQEAQNTKLNVNIKVI